MRPHWTFEPADADQYLGGARYILAAVVLIAIVVLPFVVVRAFQVDALLRITRLEVTDNQTWLISQLEVDFLKFANAVANVRSNSPKPVSEVALLESWPEVLKRFDIFYSRLGTIASNIGTWSDSSGDWSKSQRLLDQLVLHRNQLAAILDGAADPDTRINLDALSAAVTAASRDVRELTVTTLSILTDQSNEQRLEYMRQFRAVLIETLSMVMVMTLTSVAAWLLYRQLGARAAAEHRMSENLRRIFDAKPDAILVTDRNHKILWMNLPSAGLFGVTWEEAKGQDALNLFFPGVQRKARRGETHPLTDNARAESSFTFRDIVHTSGGGTLAVEVTRIRLMTESGDETTALFVRDITETQRALRALRRERGLAEAEAARYQRFLAVMSHEIRSPLHAILASLDLARERPGASALADLHEIAMDAAQVALEEADAVLEIGRAEHEMRATEPVAFSPSHVVRDLVEMAGPAARSAGTELSVEIGPGAESRIIGLRACFWHAVSNLLSNATKFTKGGSVRLKLIRTERDLRVEVIDNGPGIAPELQTLVFRDHYTRDPEPGGRGKGAGLGLGVFVAAVEAMSGKYGLQSQLGQGSTFWFTFPAPPEGRPAPAPNRENVPAAPPVPVDLRVLVVDDSHVNRTLIEQMFMTLGLRADLAGSGAEAVALTQASAYDLILMDLSMPDMDGFAAAALIRQSGSSQGAAIVALTANALARQEVEKPGSAFDDILLKPLRLDGLRNMLAFGLHRPPAPGEGLPPVVDQDIARDLLAMLPPSAIKPLLTTMLDEAHHLARDLDRGTSDEPLSCRFHRIAGEAGMLGAGRLRALALEGEMRCKDTAEVPKSPFRATWKQTIADTSRDWMALLAPGTGQAAAMIER